MYSITKENEQKIRRQQDKRIQRLGVSCVFQLGTASLVLVATILGELHWLLPLVFLAYVLISSASIYLIFRSNLNLYFKDPSLTIFQILLAYTPPLIVMYFFESSAPRAAFIIMALVPISFGVFLLTTKQFFFIGGTLLGSFALMMILIAFNRPNALNISADILQSYSLALTIIEISLLGGYVSSLRQRLTNQNKELKEAFETIQDMANRDALTGVYNRRYLFNLLENSARDGEVLSVCLMDVDNFKTINEIYGHINGDMILQRIANQVTSVLDEGDCFGRYGGEEFLLILPATALDIAKVKADTIRHLISKITFPEIGQDFNATISIGVAQYHQNENIKDTINRADLALFEAKSLGSNHCIVKEAFSADQNDSFI